jgi:rSAM/selenodomain-associated transferase 1
MADDRAHFDTTAIIVFAKTLDAPVKTRIACSEGAATAKRIYRELVEATAASIHGMPCHVAFTGSDSAGALMPLFANAVSWFSQKGDNLGDRMKNACLHCMNSGFSNCIVIGCDCPERPLDDIVGAASALESGYDVVLGPARDGGYHLAGVNRNGTIIFDAKGWSTKSLMRETLGIVRRRRLKTAILDTRMDIDTIQDYLRWKAASAPGNDRGIKT